MTELDLTDPMVRRMADLNHTPVERWHRFTAGQLMGVTCSECGEPWQCATRRRLIELDTAKVGDDAGLLDGWVN